MILFLRMPAIASAASYYVDATAGSDSNNGTSTGTAWQTIAKVNASVFSAGDFIYLKYGEVWHETLTLPSSGNSTARITLDAYGDSAQNKPKLTGLDTMTGWSLDSGSIYKVANTYNGSSLSQVYQDGVRLVRKTSKGAMVAGSFFFDGPNDFVYVWSTDSANPATHTILFTQRPYGLYTNGQSYWNINNLWINGYALSGFNFRDTAGASNITVTSSVADFNVVRGFDFGSDTARSDMAIVNSTAHDNIGEGFWAGNATRVGCNGCTAYDNGKEITSKGYTDVIVAGANFSISDDCVDCYIKNSHSYNAYGGTDTFDVEYEGNGARPLRTIIENNFIQMSQTNTDNARDAGQDSVWKNNVFSGSPNNTMLRIWNDSVGISVFHNTFDQSGPGKACIYIPQATNVSIKNNIFYVSNGSYPLFVETAGQTGFVSDYNDWSGGSGNWAGTFYTFANWKTNTSQDTHSINVDPLFVDYANADYRLQSTSPARDVAVNLSILTDKDGNTRPYGSASDMGAYEYTVAPTPTPTPVPTTSSSNSQSSTTTSTTTQPPVCRDQAPGAKAPWLYGAIAPDSGSILLYFTPADGPVNKYVLEYGTKSGEYSFGLQDLGVVSSSQMTYLVQSLSPNTTYYFKVRGGNGCAVGTWSNEISTKTKPLLSVRQLTGTNMQLVPEEAPNPDQVVPQVESQPDPTILPQVSPTPIVQATSSGTVAPTPVPFVPDEGYQLKIQVVDSKGNPVTNAKVNVNPQVQVAFTDSSGSVAFTGIDEGQHIVTVDSDNYHGEQTINISGPVKTFDLTITVQRTMVDLSPRLMVGAGVVALFLIIGGGMVMVWRKSSGSLPNKVVVAQAP